MGICIPAYSFFAGTSLVAKRYREASLNARRQKLYEVTYFITKDTLQPLLTDTLRWKKMAFAYKNTAVIYNMQERADYYDYELDTVKQTYTLHDNPDTTKWLLFHYSYPSKDILRLTGKWKGEESTITMKAFGFIIRNMDGL